MPNPSRITAVFAQRQQRGEMAFMPFITAGDPDVATTCRLIRDLSAAGADLIEVGFPYSDPIADGPVIQESYTRALNKHIKLKEIFEAVTTVTRDVATPLVAMVSFAIVHRTGVDTFLQRAVEAGFAGLIVPDLPGDEADAFAVKTRAAGLDLIQLIAPTTPTDRAARILKNASGFVYCIAVSGTTGARDALAPQLNSMLQSLRKQTTLPLAVGFGLSRPEQVEHLRGLADGAIVGSAIVRHLASLGGDAAIANEARQKLIDYAKSIATAAHTSRS